MPARDQHLFRSFGLEVSVPPPEVDVWRQRNGEDPRSVPPSPMLPATANGNSPSPLPHRPAGGA